MSSSTTQQVLGSYKRKGVRSSARSATQASSTASVAHSSPPLVTRTRIPAFPVELLIEIIKLALDHTTEPCSPFRSPISPAKEAASLLLVCQLFRAIAIPYAYRSVTIAKPIDFVVLFGAERGVFVTGPNLEEKRAALKEICLVQELGFPLSLDCHPSVTVDGTTIGGCMEPLDLSGLRIESLTMVCLTMIEEDINRELGRVDLFRMRDAALKDDRIRAWTANRHKPPRTRSKRPQALDHALRSEVFWAHDHSQKQAFRDFAEAVHPPVLRLCPGSART